MNNLVNSKCQWSEGCESLATKLINYDFKSGELDVSSGEFLITYTKANVCDLHLLEFKKFTVM